MAITKKDVEEIGRLARLTFSGDEQEKLVEKLNRMLRYMEKVIGSYI